jgi:hypothetical protein
MLSTAPRGDHRRHPVPPLVTLTDLDDRRCRLPGWGAWPLSALTRSRTAFALPQTTVLLMHRRALSGAPAAARALSTPGAHPVTVRAWLAGWDGGEVASWPVLHNLDPAGAEEAVIELAGLADWHPEADRAERLALVVQRFVPAQASARIRVDRAAGEISVSSCWGLDEGLDTAFPHDRLVLDLAGLTVRSHEVAAKPVAIRAAGGGTTMTAVPAHRRHEVIVGDELGRRLGSVCKRLTEQFGCDAEFDLAVDPDEILLLAVRPWGESV